MKQTRLSYRVVFTPSLIIKYCLAVLLCTGFATVGYSQGNCQGQIVQLQGSEAITIDGTGNETAWLRATPSPILQLTVGQNQAGFSAQWRAVWNTTTLYIYVEVTDPSINKGNGPDNGNFFNHDAIELFIDGNNSKDSTNPPTYPAGNHQYGFCLGNPPNGISIGATTQVSPTTGMNYAVANTAGGYNVEIAIPFATIGGAISAPAVGSLLGFDVAVDDATNGSGTRSAQYSWHATGPLEYQFPSQFGTTQLVNCPIPPLTLDTLYHHLTCSGANDGAIGVHAVGGIAPYQYKLNSGSFSAATTDTIYRGLAAGSYTISVQDAIGTSYTLPTSIVLKPFVNPLVINLDNGTVCAGSPATLTASGGSSYTWTGNPSATAGLTTNSGATITVKPTATTTYTVTSSAATNLILNPGFEDDNILFKSDYIHFGAASLPVSNTQETYGIVKNATDYNASFNSFTDHSGNGYMLVADGAVQNDGTVGTSPIIPGKARVWSQTVDVVPGTTYSFSYWLHQGSAQAPKASMQVQINNSTAAIGGANPVSATNAWVYQPYTWTATTNTATIALYDLSTNSNGNDLAIDDLSLTAICSITHDTTVVVSPFPVAGISHDTTICSGTAPTVIVVGTPSAILTYQIVGQPDQAHPLASAGTVPDTGIYQIPTTPLTTNTQYVAKLIANATGLFCTTVLNDTMKVTVVPMPGTVTISKDTSVCTGQTAFVHFKGTAKDSVTYTIDSNAVHTVNTMSLGITGDTTITTGAITTQTILSLVSVKYPGAVSCSQPISGTITLSIGNPPVATISGATAVCAGSPATTITITGTAGAKVTYDVIQGNTTVSSNIVTLNASGTNSFSTGVLTATTVYKLRSVSLSSACTNPLSDSVIVTVNPLPTVGFKITQTSLCAANALDFTDTSFSNIQSRVWNFGDGTATSPLATPSHTYATANTYTVSLQVTDNNSCTNKTTQSIVINPLPQPGFTLPVICMANGTATIQLTATNTGTANVTGWEWSFDDNTTQTTQTVNQTYTTVGAHPIELIETSDAGCKGFITQNDTAYASPTVMDSIVNATALCSNNPVVLINESTVQGGSLTKVEIYWDNANAVNKSLQTDNAPTANETYSKQYAALATDANYDVLLKVYSGNQCPASSITTTITVHGSPVVSFASLATVCQETPEFVLSGGSPLGGSYNGAGVVGDSAFLPQIAGAGTFPITYTYQTANGCYSSDASSIIVSPTPVVDYGGTVSVLEGDSVTLSPAKPLASGLQYMWSPSIYLDSDTSATPVSKPVDSVTYTITVKSPGGCQGSTTLFIQVLHDFDVPNTFTPNNDGINDKWVIAELPKYPIQWVQVFDRYGQLIYESHGYGTPWDGTYKGSQLPSGTYYYVIELNGLLKPKTGYITILR